MAGSQNPDENPVAINVVPMVDVIFCLCVFFMCSFEFKQTEGNIEAWLPQGKGIGPTSSRALLEEIRVALVWDPVGECTRRKFGTRHVAEEDQLETLIGASKRDFDQLNLRAPVVIDADSRVPWNEVVTVLNVAKRAGVDQVEFAWGAP